MKKNTVSLFVRPLLLQEIAIVSILTPIVLFFFRFVSDDVTRNFVPVSIAATLAANWGLFLGFRRIRSSFLHVS